MTVHVSRTSAADRPAAKNATCKGCGGGIVKHASGWDRTPVIVTDTQVSCMRGDDEVRCYHPSCYEGQEKVDELLCRQCNRWMATPTGLAQHNYAKHDDTQPQQSRRP